jgi:hypothetical protein
VVIYPERTDAPVCIGTQNSDSFLLGGITRVRVRGRALAGEEIRALYESDAVPRMGIVAEFLLDRDTGHSAEDSSGLGNDGRIVNGTWAVQA